MLVATILENIVGQDEIPTLEDIVGQDEIPVLDINVKVATTSYAVVIVASALLKVVDVEAAPVLEGVDVEVDILLVVSDNKPQQLKRLRLEGTEPS